MKEKDTPIRASREPAKSELVDLFLSVSRSIAALVFAVILLVFLSCSG